MDDNQFRIVKALFLAFLCYILYCWVQTERYYVIDGELIIDKVKKEVFYIYEALDGKEIHKSSF